MQACHFAPRPCATPHLRQPRRLIRSDRPRAARAAVTLERPSDAPCSPAIPSELPRSTLQGSDDWKRLIRNEGRISKPSHLDQALRSTLVKYGELTQICYDSFYGDESDRNTFGESELLAILASDD